MAKLYPYSNRTAALLRNPPFVGGNRHQWLFTIQAQLTKQGFEPEAIEKALQAFCERAGWGDRLPEVAQNTAAITGNEYVENANERISWPDINHAERIARYTFPPMFQPTDTGLMPSEVLPQLYAPDELLCIAPNRFQSHVYPTAQAATLAHNQQFIIPNPLRRETGLTKAGKVSGRSKDNACTENGRRYAVIEFDTKDALPDQCAVLSSLHSDFAPLVMAVFSGGKSIHGWYDVSALNMNDKRRFYWAARYLGADSALWNRAALVRMPGGIRDGGLPQPILYFNSTAIKRKATP